MSNEKLFIVESPNKVKTIHKFLGNEFQIEASVGHIFEIANIGEHGLGIDTVNWKPKYKVESSKKAVVKKLKELAKKSEIVYIATDPDREGEAIGDNIIEELGIRSKYKRVIFNEITEQAIKNSIKHPTVIDEHLVNAQKTRQMLDKIIGFRLTSLLKSKIKNGPTSPSAGRVQSVVLKMIIDHEELIKNFKSTKYTKIFAKWKENQAVMFLKKDYLGNNRNWIKRDKADEIMRNLNSELKVTDVKVKKTNNKKVLPLVLDELIRKANNRYGMRSYQVERTAQSLYELGLISYPRTDSHRYSDYFLNQAKVFIGNNYGNTFIDNVFFEKKKVSKKITENLTIQDAHEAIRPTDIFLSPAQVQIQHQLNSLQSNLFKFIYYETLKSMMKPPIYENWNYLLQDQEYLFEFTEKKLFFEGHLVLGFDRSQVTQNLSNLSKGDVLKCQYEKIDYESQPPARFSDGKLISNMKKVGIGRPSTYGMMVQTILKRKFADEEKSKEVQNENNEIELKSTKARLKPTEFGFIVYSKLASSFPHIINEQYTAMVERDLDEIAKNKVDYKNFLTQFYKKFNSEVETYKETMQSTKVLSRETGFLCPLDQGKLIYKFNRWGKEFIACDNFPDCREAYATLEEAQNGKKNKKEVIKAGIKCPKCQSDLVVRVSKRNLKEKQFVGCSTFPKCRTIFSTTNIEEINQQIKSGDYNKGKKKYTKKGGKRGKI